MRALTLGPDGPQIVDRPLPSCQSEARLRLRLGGICATDLELCRGYMGFQGTLGHEFVADVLDAPDPSWVGARVVGEINCPCGACPTCRAGRPTHCPQRSVLGIVGRDGAFAEQLSLPLANLHRVPASVSDEDAVFVEPLAAALQILQQVHVRPTDRVVVLGVGRLGQLCARVLQRSGAQVHAVSRNPDRLRLLPAGVLHGAPSTPADLVVDCTGSPQGLAQASALLRPRGTLVLKTTLHEPAPAPVTPWVIDEITVVGSRCGPFAPALRLLASGQLDLAPLITARHTLSDGLAALAAASQAAHIKVLLAP